MNPFQVTPSVQDVYEGDKGGERDDGDHGHDGRRRRLAHRRRAHGQDGRTGIGADIHAESTTFWRSLSETF